MLPRFGAKERLSEVRFSSSTLSSGPMGGTGNGPVGDFLLFGRNMVLNPLPIQLPVNAASGPRAAGVTLTGAIRSCLTSRTEKLAGKENAMERTLVLVISPLVVSHV